MSSLNKGLGKVEVTLKWDPSPLGEPDIDLDIIAGTYRAEDPYGDPAYLVHFDSRSPDGTITLNRDSRTGQGFGIDEALTVEFERLSEEYARVVVGVAIQQREERRAFGDVAHSVARIAEGVTELAAYDFERVAGATAATIAEFRRDEAGVWVFREDLRGFDADPEEFGRLMGRGSG